MTKNNRLNIVYADRFHEINLFLPTRTIYFAGVDAFDKTESDVIDSVTIAQLIKNLHILDYNSNDPITLILNTCGGEWESGIAVYDVIKKIKSKVLIIGMGKIYSMGAVIFQAGWQRLIYPNAWLMIHDGTFSYGGDSKSFENWAKNSKEIRKTMYKIFYEKMKIKNPKISLKTIEHLCSHDTILNAKEAVKLGLADQVA